MLLVQTFNELMDLIHPVYFLWHKGSLIYIVFFKIYVHNYFERGLVIYLRFRTNQKLKPFVNQHNTAIEVQY